MFFLGGLNLFIILNSIRFASISRAGSFIRHLAW